MITLFIIMGLSCPNYTEMCTELNNIRPFKSSRMPTCERVAEVAEEWDIDPLLLISVAWHESRFNNKAVSRAGAVGALQILPKWFCGSQKCDYIHVGGRAFTRWRKRAKGNLYMTLAMYNGGNSPGKRSFRYAKVVMRTYKLLKRKCRVPGC